MCMCMCVYERDRDKRDRETDLVLSFLIDHSNERVQISSQKLYCVMGIPQMMTITVKLIALWILYFLSKYLLKAKKMCTPLLPREP
jgi:hypothetical protein